jgi:cytochrome c biogenesis protein CcdA
MALVGLVTTFVGFLLAAASVGIAGGTSTRLILVLAGIVISLVGIIGLINPAYQQNAVWKK